MKQNYFLKAAGMAAILVVMSNQASAQSSSDVVSDVKAVKVVDNKGTIKYFQSSNGITQIVNTTNNLTTTTWQLGGTLTDDTYIDATGKVFGLKGLDMTTLNPSVDGSASGYTMLVSNALTGKVERMLATSLVDGGYVENVLLADNTATYVIAASDLPGLTVEVDKISVFRNGIKLRQSDWALASGAISIAATANLPLYEDDVLEIQWIN